MALLFIRVKEIMKELCVHEIFIVSNKDEALVRGGAQMCPKLSIDNVDDSIASVKTVALADAGTLGASASSSSNSSSNSSGVKNKEIK
jgi:hypothetical protein